MTISVPERGETFVGAGEWNLLQKDATFWRLVEEKILSVNPTGTGACVLRGGAFVGRSMTAAGPLELHEKIPGALQSLLRFASYDAFRVTDLKAPSSEVGPLLTLLVRAFHRAVRSYVTRGRERRYIQQKARGSLVGGRIDITQTLALRARGLAHLIAFERNVLDRATLKNRVVLAALREVEKLQHVVPVLPRDLAAGRGLVQFFNDCRDREVLFGLPSTFASHADALLAKAPAQDRDMLALAGIILAHESFEHDRPKPGTAPKAWFLNLEKLFEKAVRRSLRRELPHLGVTKGASHERPIFTAGTSPHDADPDLVLQQPGHDAVGDVKYKEWPGEKVPRDDLYQLLVHAAAFDSSRAFLVYPHDRFESVHVGTAATGADVWMFGVDVAHLDQGSVAIGAELGFSADVPVEAAA